ncbi:hypothetical protein BN946_scf184929.g2 [Trametes cinnabarina]|uniref:Uncharacterized protein n=1 Tax=Pycnoporus cinnabarinus TaxID=5643 RepID=A0A060SVA1_PYCCI|nr:hypothetical protein BN946_scf184929.g2 [Trametes cinnabarina]
MHSARYQLRVAEAKAPTQAITLPPLNETVPSKTRRSKTAKYYTDGFVATPGNKGTEELRAEARKLDNHGNIIMVLDSFLQLAWPQDDKLPDQLSSTFNPHKAEKKRDAPGDEPQDQRASKRLRSAATRP